MSAFGTPFGGGSGSGGSSDPIGAGGVYEYVEEVDLAGLTEATFTVAAGVQQIKLVCPAVLVGSGDAQWIYAQFNGDTGGTSYRRAVYYVRSDSTSAVGSQTSDNTNSGVLGYADEEGGSFEALIPTLSGANHLCIGDSAVESVSSNYLIRHMIGSEWKDTSAITSVRIYGQHGNTFTAGKVYVYKLVTAASGSSAHVGVKAALSADSTLANNSQTHIAFDAESYDTDDFHDVSTNNTRCTIPSGADGYYLVTGAIQVGTFSSGIVGLTLRVNGASMGGGIAPASSSGLVPGCTVSEHIYLTAGDYVELRAYQNSGSTLTLYSVGTFLQLAKLGT